MKDIDLYLSDSALTHSLQLSRFTAGEQKKVLAVLVQMQKELRGKLSNGDLTEWGRARVTALLKQCNEVIAQGYNAAQGMLDLEGLAQVEAEAVQMQLVAVGLEASLPTVAAMKALVNGSVIEGSPASAWWKKQSTDLQFKFANAVRQGIAQGEDMQAITRRVFGSAKLGTQGIGFPLDTLRREAYSLVHASVMSVATDARIEAFRANADVIDCIVWLATLDGKTCPVCGARDLKQYDLMTLAPIGHSLAWLGGPGKAHFGCRCTPTTKTKSWKELGAPDLQDLPPGERASSDGPVSADLSFEGWLSRRSKEEVTEMFGPGRADLYLSGKITLKQFTDGQGRAIGLDKLRGKG